MLLLQWQLSVEGKIQSSRQIVLSQTRKKLGRWGWTLDPVVLSQRLVLDFIQFLRFQNSRFHVSMLLIELAQCARTDSGVQVLRKFYRSGKTNIRRSGFEGN